MLGLFALSYPTGESRGWGDLRPRDAGKKPALSWVRAGYVCIKKLPLKIPETLFPWDPGSPGRVLRFGRWQRRRASPRCSMGRSCGEYGKQQRAFFVTEIRLECAYLPSEIFDIFSVELQFRHRENLQAIDLFLRLGDEFAADIMTTEVELVHSLRVDPKFPFLPRTAREMDASREMLTVIAMSNARCH